MLGDLIEVMVIRGINVIETKSPNSKPVHRTILRLQRDFGVQGFERKGFSFGQ